MADSGKSEGAFRTIGEVSQDLGVPQHILRYWETRFPQLRPLQRAGNRRYYRPADVTLVKRIDRLLNHEGYTIRGVQKLLSEKTPDVAPAAAPAAPIPAAPSGPVIRTGSEVRFRTELREIRDELKAALSQ